VQAWQKQGRKLQCDTKIRKHGVKHAGSLLELIQKADSTASAQMMRIAQEQLQQGS